VIAAAAEPGVAIVDQEAERLLAIVERHQEVARLLRDPGASWIRCAGDELDPAALEWEWPGLPRPTLSPGRSSAGTAAMPPSPGSGSAEGTGARPSPVLLFSRSRSQSPSPAWDPMGPCSGRPGLPISISGRIAPLREREPPSECEHATTKVTPAKEGGRRCHRSGRRRIRRQSSLARRASRSRSRRRRRRAGSHRGRSRPVASPVCAAASSISARLTDETIVRGFKTTVRLENEAFRGVNRSFETLHAPCAWADSTGTRATPTPRQSRPARPTPPPRPTRRTDPRIRPGSMTDGFACPTGLTSS
jgi:hypothetical protein